MNAVTLIGNLCTDVELKDVGEGKKLARFLLAVDRPGQLSGADFVWIVVWERQAESCARYLSKSKRVAVDGRLRSRSWQEDGRRRSSLEVVANSVQFLSPADVAAAAEAPAEPVAAVG